MKKTTSVYLFCFALGIAVFSACSAQGQQDLSLREPAGHTETINITFVNDTDFDFTRLYISPDMVETWGENHLGGTVLAGGETTGTQVSGGSGNGYDMRVEDEDGDAYEFAALPMADGAVVRVTFEEGLSVVVDYAHGGRERFAGTLMPE